MDLLQIHITAQNKYRICTAALFEQGIGVMWASVHMVQAGVITISIYIIDGALYLKAA